MNPLFPYWPWGRQATATVTFLKVPNAGTVITIDGVDFLYGTDFAVGRTIYDCAESLSSAVNADRARQNLAPAKTNPFGAVHAQFYGNVVRLYATEPGEQGNDITLEVDNGYQLEEKVTVSGATFDGGTNGQTISVEVGDVTIGTIKLEDGDSSAKLDIGANGDGKNAAYVQQSSQPLPTGASTEATLAAIKAKTDNIDVALSTRTKPADAQHVIIDSGISALATAAKQDTGNTSIAAVNTAIGAKADAAASDDTGTFSLISLFKRLLQGITSIATRATFPTTKAAGTVVSSATLESGHQLMAAPGTLLKLSGYSNAAVAQWIQLFDTATEPSPDDVPVFTAKVLVTSNFPFLDVEGLHFAAGCWVKNSEDPEKLDENDADCFFHARIVLD